MIKVYATKIVVRDQGRPTMRVYWETNNQSGVTDIVHDDSFPYGKASPTDILTKLKEVLGDEKVALLESKE